MNTEVFKTFLLSKIKEEGLPGDLAHQDLAPLKRLKHRLKIAENTNPVEASVAVVLFPSKNKIKSILIKRPVYRGHHSGQISFPGGKRELSESLIETAIRECKEEIGLQLSKKEMLFKLSDIYIPVSNFMISPNVFVLDQEPKGLKPDKREVEEIILFDTDVLLDKKVRKSKDIRITSQLRQKDVPYFDIQQKVVWGATAMILSELAFLLKK